LYIDRQKSAAEWLTYFSKEFESESNRAAAIISTALLEHHLEILLKNTLVTSPDKEDKLFDGPIAPLSGFYSKIEMSYRLGLIPLQFRKDLHLIREIRNKFGHNITRCDFKDKEIRLLIKKLGVLESMIMEDDERAIKVTANPRIGYQYSVAWLLFCIVLQSLRIKRIPKEVDSFMMKLLAIE